MIIINKTFVKVYNLYINLFSFLNLIFLLLKKVRFKITSLLVSTNNKILKILFFLSYIKIFHVINLSFFKDELSVF